MKYPLRVKKEHLEEVEREELSSWRIILPRLGLSAEIGSKRRFGSIDRLYVDTGAPKTILYPKDIDALDIDVRRLRKKEDPIEYGVPLFKKEMDLYPIREVKVTLMNEDGEGELMEPESIYVLGETVSEIDEEDIMLDDKKKINGMNSLIGLDFLESTGLGLYINPSENIAHFMSGDS